MAEYSVKECEESTDIYLDYLKTYGSSMPLWYTISGIAVSANRKMHLNIVNLTTIRNFLWKRQAIPIHKALKQAFNDCGLERIPSIKELNVMYHELMSEKTRYNQSIIN